MDDVGYNVRLPFGVAAPINTQALRRYGHNTLPTTDIAESILRIDCRQVAT